MKVTTSAIVLYLAKYSDKAGILHVYTEKFGRMAYMIYGINGKKRSELLVASEPFSLVEIEVNHSVGKEIQTLYSISLQYISTNTTTDIRKRTIAMFISDILYHTLRHPEPESALFDFLTSEIKYLDLTLHPENFHLRFLLQYTYYLGIMPSLDEYDKMLNIKTGLLVEPSVDSDNFSVDETNFLIDILSDENVVISRSVRRSILDKLCKYYEFHLTDFFSPKSLDVLYEVFD